MEHIFLLDRSLRGFSDRWRARIFTLIKLLGCTEFTFTLPSHILYILLLFIMCFGNGGSHDDIELTPRRARQSPSHHSSPRHGEIVGGSGGSMASGVSGRVVTIAPGTKGKGRAESAGSRAGSGAGSGTGSGSGKSWDQMDWDAHPDIRHDYAGYKAQGKVHAAAKQDYIRQKVVEKKRLKDLPKPERQALRNAFGEVLPANDLDFPTSHRNLEAHGMTWEDEALRSVSLTQRCLLLFLRLAPT